MHVHPRPEVALALLACALAAGAPSASRAAGEASARHARGRELAAAERYEEAALELQAAVALDPGPAAPWADLGEVEGRLGRHAAAVSALREARARDPGDVAVLEALGAAAERRAAAELPARARDALARASLATMRGSAADAERAWSEVLAAAPRFADAHYGLGRIAQGRGELERAEREYRAALAGYGPDEVVFRADAQVALSDVLVRRGRTGPEPRRLVEEALRLRADRPVWRAALARACEASGDRPCAAREWRGLSGGGEAVPAALRDQAAERLRALER